jgi:preprotein translocase subunit SecF
VGIFSIFDKEFTLPIIAALLTIIGYSLNDTIIVFDRIRENTRKHHKKPLEFIINRSINETLSRTILTSLTTLLVVVTLFVLGGGIIHDFAFALIIGVVVGTYSSIYVASPILLAWQGRGKK